MKTEAEADRAVELYAGTVRRICYLYLKNNSDTEDVFQDVFFKYILRNQPFESDAHEKAWLIRVTINACQDMLKNFFRRKARPLDDAENQAAPIPESNQELLEAVLALPQNYKNAVYLYYFEGYSAAGIAQILHTRENTVYTWLSRARAKLRDMLGGERFEG